MLMFYVLSFKGDSKTTWIVIPEDIAIRERYNTKGYYFGVFEDAINIACALNEKERRKITIKLSRR